MNVLQSLTELFNSQDADSVYRILALKILSNLDQMKRVTIYDVAELTSSSRTTVWRLVQKLGYESFSDFRYALQSAASQYVYYNRMVEQRKASSPTALLTEVESQLSGAVDILRSGFTENDLEELTDEISDMTRLYFFLPFRSSFVYSFQQNLWKDGKLTEYHCLIPDMLNASDDLDQESAVLISTIEYAETMDMTKVFDKIKNKGAVIWLAGNSESRFSNYADRHLLTGRSPAAAWLLAFESFLLALSERYRAKFIDRSVCGGLADSPPEI